MQIQVFKFSMTDSQKALDEMNKFLRSFKIIEVEKEFVSDGANSFWSFCVSYLKEENTTYEKKGKIDYKEVIEPQVFKIFSALREVRKQIAEDKAVPVFAVFSNKELAEIAALSEINATTLKTVKGIGDKKMEKFGADLIRLYASSQASQALN